GERPGPPAAVLLPAGGRGPRDREPAEVAEDDLRPDIDARRVAERLAGRQRVGVDVGGADDGEPVFLDRGEEGSLDESAEHLAPDLVAEHALDDRARCLPRSEAAQPRLLAN